MSLRSLIIMSATPLALSSGGVIDPHLKTGLTVILSRGHDRAMLTYSGSIGALRLDHLDLSVLPRAASAPSVLLFTGQSARGRAEIV
jgi:hypothetical protein